MLTKRSETTLKSLWRLKIKKLTNRATERMERASERMKRESALSKLMTLCKSRPCTKTFKVIFRTVRNERRELEIKVSKSESERFKGSST
jgi:hypothetical protein